MMNRTPQTLEELYAMMGSGEYAGFEEDIVGAMLAPPAIPGLPAGYPPGVQPLYGGYGITRPPGYQAVPYQGPLRSPTAMRSAYPAAGLAPAPPLRLQRVPQGVDSGPVAIAAGATVDIDVQPQVKFRPERLIVTDSVAPFFLINDIKVGKNSQLPSTDPVPATVFVSNATDVQLAFRTCYIGQKIVVSVTNIDAAGHRFTGAFVGATAEN